jgi:hypothetical protein
VHDVDRRGPVVVEHALDPDDHVLAGAHRERREGVLARFFDERRQRRRRRIGERRQERSLEQLDVRGASSEQMVTAKFAARTSSAGPGRSGCGSNPVDGATGRSSSTSSTSTIVALAAAACAFQIGPP